MTSGNDPHRTRRSTPGTTTPVTTGLGTTGPATTGPIKEAVTLSIGGMTCASCAMRIEKKLNKIDGVSATVNYATEHASVQAPPNVSVDDLIATVESAGYSAAQRPQATPNATAEGATDADRDPQLASLRTRLIVSAGLAVPVIVLAMIPALQFDGWQWVSLLLATPVVTWGAWPFHRAAWINLQHGAATMDTLISVGVIAAWLSALQFSALS